MRLVSLCPSITETLFALGVGDEVVGRTRYCIHPKPQVRAIPHVGGTKNPDLARIVRLSPDFVFVNTEENRTEDIAAMRSMGLPVVEYFPSTIAETIDYISDLGQRVDRIDLASVIASSIREALARCRALEGPEKTFAALIWWDPLMLAGSSTFMSRLLEEAGFRNAFPVEEPRYPTISLDELNERSPDTVFLTSEPFPFKEKHRRRLIEALGIDGGRIQLVDGELLSWHGARTAKGLDYVGRLRAGSRDSPPTPQYSHQ